MTLAIVGTQVCEVAPNLNLAPFQAYLTVPTQSGREVKGQFVVEFGGVPIEHGIVFFVMKTNTLKLAIDHLTGEYHGKGIGSATLRAVIPGYGHVDREVTTLL